MSRATARHLLLVDPSPRAIVVAVLVISLILGGMGLGIWFGGRQAISLTVCTRQGYDALAADDWQTALGHFDRAVWLDPANASAYFGRAQVYELRNDRARAIGDYQSVIRLQPEGGAQSELARQRIKALGGAAPHPPGAQP